MKIKHQNAATDFLRVNLKHLNESIGEREWTALLEAKLGEENFGIVYRATMTKHRKSKTVAINFSYSKAL